MSNYQTPIDYVDDGKFPRDIRDTLNDLVERANEQQWEVRFTEDLSPQGAKVDMSDKRVVIYIPRGGLLASLLKGGFSLQTQKRAQNNGGVKYQWGVYPGLLKNTQTNIKDGDQEYIGVTGCLANNFKPTDVAWSDIPTNASPSAPARIWIEVAAGTWPGVDSAYVNNAPWGGGELEYANDTNSPPNAVQTYARFVVGQVTHYNPDATASPIIVPFPGCAQLQLSNGGDVAFDSAHSNGKYCPFWYPVVN